MPVRDNNPCHYPAIRDGVVHTDGYWMTFDGISLLKKELNSQVFVQQLNHLMVLYMEYGWHRCQQSEDAVSGCTEQRENTGESGGGSIQSDHQQL